MQQEEEKLIQELGQVRKKIKTECGDAYDVNLHKRLLNTAQKDIEHLGSEIQKCSDAASLEVLMNQDLKKITNWLKQSQKDAIADAKQNEEDNEEALLKGLALLPQATD